MNKYAHKYMKVPSPKGGMIVPSPVLKVMAGVILLVTLAGSYTLTSRLFWSSKCTDSYLRNTNLVNKNPQDPTSAHSVYDFFAKDVDGKVISLDIFKGNVLMIVNAASE